MARYVQRSSGAVNHSTTVLLFKSENRTTIIRRLGPIVLILCTSATSSKISTKQKASVEGDLASDRFPLDWKIQVIRFQLRY